MSWVKYTKELHNNPEKLKAFMKSVLGPERRELLGDEKAHMLTLLEFLTPERASNNQRVYSEQYIHANKLYSVTYFGHDDVLLEESALEGYDDIQ